MKTNNINITYGITHELTNDKEKAINIKMRGVLVDNALSIADRIDLAKSEQEKYFIFFLYEYSAIFDKVDLTVVDKQLNLILLVSNNNEYYRLANEQIKLLMIELVDYFLQKKYKLISNFLREVKIKKFDYVAPSLKSDVIAC